MRWLKKFDDISLRVSYTNKVKFLLLIYILISYTMLSTLINLQKPLVTLTEHQLMVLPYHANLLDAAQKSASYAFGREKSLAGLEMESSLLKLRALPQTVGADFFKDQSESTQEWNLLLSQAIQLWQEIIHKQAFPANPDSPFQQFTHTLHLAWTLLDQNSSGLYLTDLGTHRLAKIFFQDVMEIQEASSSFIQTLMLSSNQSDDHLKVRIKALKAYLITNMQQMTIGLEESLLENPNPNSDPKSLSLQGYLILLQDSLEKMLALTQQSPPLEILSLGMQVQENNSQFAHEVEERLQLLVSEQQNTLLFRQWVSVACFCFGGCIFAMFYFTRVMRRPLTHIRHATEELLKGNLYVRTNVQTKDETNEISNAFNQTVEMIENIIVQAGSITNTLAGSSEEISLEAKNLRLNVVDQEKSIQQIITNSRAISQTVNDCVHFLHDVNKSAVNTSVMAAEGRESLIEMESIMQQLLDASHKINSTLEELRKKILTTSTVIQTVVRISDQSNLLALNSSLRTHNTGLHQSGFGVIADKIRELADQTAFVTLNIESEVIEIMNALLKTEEIVHTFSQEIQAQAQEALRVRESFKKLIWNVQEQVKAFDNVNHDMQTQAANAGEIHETIFLLKDLSKKTTVSSTRLNDEIDLLSKASKKLNEMIKEFKTHAKTNS